MKDIFFTCFYFSYCRLSELRQQKQKLSRQVRDKEEELENSLQKIDSLRQDIRKAEKLRREIELRAEEATTEAVKEKKLREKADTQIKVIWNYTLQHVHMSRYRYLKKYEKIISDT